MTELHIVKRTLILLHMKNICLSILLSTLFVPALFGQHRKSIRVKGGDDVAQAYSSQGFYRFPQFTKGALFSKQRSGNSSMLFNYNMLDDKIQYINGRDTMDMMNPSLFDSVAIDNRVFYYDKDLGVIELMGRTPSLRLVKDISIKIKPEVVGAYNASSSTSAVSRVQGTVVNNRVYTFSMNEDVVLKETIDLYWINDAGSLMKATKKNLLAQIPAEKKAWAETFIKQNKIEFDKEEDLLRLATELQASH